MKVTVIKSDEKKKNDNSLVYSIIMLCLGIVLVLNAKDILTIIFSILGMIVIIFGGYQLVRYFNMKKRFKVEDTNTFVTALTCFMIGCLIVLLSNVLNSAIQVVTGIWLFFIGLSKFREAFYLKNVNNRLVLRNYVEAFIFLVLDIYSITAQNVIFVIIGWILIITASYDLINYFKK